MERNSGSMLSMLPQQFPFRFVEQVLHYEPQCILIALFLPITLKRIYSNFKEVPPSILIEGLAQCAVLLTQLETQPLKKGETPLLGGVEASIKKMVDWNKKLIYRVEPIRILPKHAVLKGSLYDEDNLKILDASFSVAVAENGG